MDRKGKVLLPIMDREGQRVGAREEIWKNFTLTPVQLEHKQGYKRQAQPSFLMEVSPPTSLALQIP